MLHVSQFSNWRARLHRRSPAPDPRTKNTSVAAKMSPHARGTKTGCRASSAQAARRDVSQDRMTLFQVFYMFLHLVDLYQSCYSLHVDLPISSLPRIMVSPNQPKNIKIRQFQLVRFNVETDGFGDPLFQETPIWMFPVPTWSLNFLVMGSKFYDIPMSDRLMVASNATGRIQCHWLGCQDISQEGRVLGLKKRG